MPKKIETEEEAMFAEYGVAWENTKLYRVENPFFLKVCDGPLKPVEVGTLVRLDSNRTGPYLFDGGKVAPVELGELFEVTQPYRTVGPGTEYVYLEKGDILKLSREEAIPLLRELKIKEKKGVDP